MKIKTIKLQSPEGDAALTELMFEIASARAEGTELLQLDVPDSDEGGGKLTSYLLRKLKSIKQKGQIQFFAATDNFEKGSTEAIFLLNKYPDHFEYMRIGEHKNRIYVKI